MNPTTTKSWQALQTHAQSMRGASLPDASLPDLFRDKEERVRKFSIRFGDLLIDYSKNLISEETMQHLCMLAEETGVEELRDAMFAGEKINHTEDRAVLHTALRNLPNLPVMVDGEDVAPLVKAEREKMAQFTQKVRSGDWTGYTGKTITDVVNIGIGGSHLGPQMACHALFPDTQEGMRFHFLSNVDGMSFVRTVKPLNPETTLFIVSSKTFTTIETRTNADSCRAWFLESGATEADICKHFVAVSTNRQAVIDFGIDPDNMFTMWDLVGGRYSLWSAIGLPVMLAIGEHGFYQLLAGAFAMDKHFQITPLNENIPVVLALLGVWYHNFLGAETTAVLPYADQLELLPAYLQQLDMESNGKRVDREGKPVNYATGPVLWGMQGINGQHAFYQLIHQSDRLIPCDFIGVLEPASSVGIHQDVLWANFIGQTEALMMGRPDAPEPHKHFSGNHPTNSIAVKKLTPYALGMLVAMYEHKVFVQGAIWNLNSFDQWGVELGKILASTIQQDFVKPEGEHDASTRALVEVYRQHRNL
jgi:glucose-6-phosphate isomerase